MWMTHHRLGLGVATLALGGGYALLATVASETIADTVGAVYALAAVAVTFLLGLARLYR